MKPKVGSMFAGIGGFDLGFERAGFEIAWCIEWDKSAQAVLRRRFPGARIFGDIREVTPDQLDRVDVICGGFPCQDLSVAGKRAGLEGKRSGLFHDAMRLVRKLDPSVLVLENVPGLLSSNHGRDFATVLREVGEGWSCEEVGWRVLDSQFFGVAQRRRRVFVVAVGHSRKGGSEEILSLATSCGGNPPKSRTTRETTSSGPEGGTPYGMCADIVGTLTRSSAYDLSREMVDADLLIPVPFRKSKRAQSDTDDETWIQAEKANTLNGFDVGDRDTHAIAISIQDGREIQKSQNGIGIGDPGSPGYTIDTTGAQGVAISFDEELNSRVDLAGTLSRGGEGGRHDGVMISPSMMVRRLTPRECERLQGFPDGWTDIGTPEKPTSDTHRYKQLGNAVTVNVAEWIARRTMMVLQGG